MKKLLLTVMLVVTFFALSAVPASAVVNDTVKVGLRYGSSALFSANLENAVGSGYEFGYYDADEEECRYDILKDAAPGEAKGRCVYCSHCAPCPKGLDIALINKYYDLARTGDPLAADHYDNLSIKADACTECGRCNRRCPFGVDQKERLKEIDAYFKKTWKERKK